jgi:hypothetical protein
MKHLSESELTDALDVAVSPDRAAHLRDCGRCSDAVDAMRVVLSRLDVDVPEPSPLFWDHLSTRVRQQIEEQAARPRLEWMAGWRLPGIAAIALAATLLLAVPVSRTRPGGPTSLDTPAQSASAVRLSSAPDYVVADDIETDEAWAVVRAVAEDAVWEEVNDAGISARPGSVELAVSELTETERSELAALLREELRRVGA